MFWEHGGNKFLATHAYTIYKPKKKTSFHNHWILEIDYTRKPIKKNKTKSNSKQLLDFSHQWFQLFCDTKKLPRFKVIVLQTTNGQLILSCCMRSSWHEHKWTSTNQRILPKLAKKESTISYNSSSESCCPYLDINVTVQTSCPWCWIWGMTISMYDG